MYGLCCLQVGFLEEKAPSNLARIACRNLKALTIFTLAPLRKSIIEIDVFNEHCRSLIFGEDVWCKALVRYLLGYVIILLKVVIGSRIRRPPYTLETLTNA